MTMSRRVTSMYSTRFAIRRHVLEFALSIDAAVSRRDQSQVFVVIAAMTGLTADEAELIERRDWITQMRRSNRCAF